MQPKDLKLEKLFKIRDKQEKIIKNRLGQVLNLHKKMKDQQESIYKDLKDRGSKDILDENGFLSLAAATCFDKGVSHNLQQISQTNQEMECLLDKIKDLKGHFLKATLERKIIEKFKNKRIQEYENNLKRKNLNCLDDLNQKKISGHFF